MLILGAHLLRQIEQRAEASFQRRIAINLGDHPAVCSSLPNADEAGKDEYLN